MLDAKRQELYDRTIKRLEHLNRFLHNRIEPFDDRAAIVLIAEECEYYRSKLQGIDEEILSLKRENKKLRKVIVKQVLKMHGDDND